MPVKMIRRVLLCSVLMAALPLCGSAEAANHYDAVKQFRLKSNPNGVWTYMDTDPLLYSHHAYEGVKGLENWSDDNSDGTAAFVILNTTGGNVMVDNGATLIPTGYLALDAEAAPTGADLRFTAPVAGTYIVKLAVIGLNTNEASDTVLFVFYNNMGNEIWYTKVHSHTHKHTQLTVVMAAGDTLDFLDAHNPHRGLDYVGVSLKITGP